MRRCAEVHIVSLAQHLQTPRTLAPEHPLKIPKHYCIVWPARLLLHTSSLQNSPFNGHLLEVINAPANKWSLRAPWAPKLYHCEIEREVVFETRSRSKSWYTNSYSIGRSKSYSITRSKSYSIKRDRSCNRSRIRLRDRSRIRLKETEVVIDCYIETGFGNNLLPFAFADFCLIWRSISDCLIAGDPTIFINHRLIV